MCANRQSLYPWRQVSLDELITSLAHYLWIQETSVKIKPPLEEWKKAIGTSVDFPEDKNNLQCHPPPLRNIIVLIKFRW